MQQGRSLTLDSSSSLIPLHGEDLAGPGPTQCLTMDVKRSGMGPWERDGVFLKEHSRCEKKPTTTKTAGNLSMNLICLLVFSVAFFFSFFFNV